MNTESQNKWVICPICHKPNKYGRKHCTNCLARISSIDPMTEEEKDIFVNTYEGDKRRRIRRKRIIVGSILTILVAGITIWILSVFTDVIFGPDKTLTSTLTNEWAMYRQNSSHTGSLNAEDTIQGNIVWTFDAGNAIQTSPAIVDGVVYFGSINHKFFAIDAVTGQLKWEFEAGSWILSSPAVVGGTVYFGSNDGYLYALNAETGEKLWAFKTAYAVKSSPAVAGNRIYFGSDDGNFYAVNTETGKEAWKYKSRSLCSSSPVIENGMVYFSSEASLYILESNTGKFRLRFQAYYPIQSSPVLDGDVVYIVNSNGDLFAVNRLARAWPWEFDIRKWWINFWLMGLPVPTPPGQSGSLWGIDLVGSCSSTPAIYGNLLYVGNEENLVAVDLENKQILWEFETGDSVESSPAYVGNTIYIGSDDGKVYAVSAADGQEIWAVQTGDKVKSSPSIAGDTLFIGSDDGKLYAIK